MYDWRDSLAAVVDRLRRGEVGVLPSDTVYGLMCRAADAAAVGRLYALKHRHRKPGTVIAASVEQLASLGIKRRYLVAVQYFWPGAVSVVVPCVGPALSYLHQGTDSLAVRIPADDRWRQLLMDTGPLLTSSANHPTHQPATTIQEAIGYFGSSVDFYVDSGSDLSGRLPSTVIRVVDDAIEVLRPGSVDVSGGKIAP